MADLYLDHQVLSKMILKVTVALEIRLVLVQMQREKLLRMTSSSHSFSWCTVDSACISFRLIAFELGGDGYIYWKISLHFLSLTTLR